MKLGVLFSGGKDSTYAAHMAKKEGHELTCLISIFSKNKESYMFHTPNIELVEIQSKKMDIPLIVKKTKGVKETELIDLEKAIKLAKDKYKIQGIVTGAIESAYQASRIQEICFKLNLKCFNPLWKKNQLDYLKEIIKNKFKVIIIGVYAYPLDESWLGREINKDFIEEVQELNEKYKINSSGEGGEFETLVLDCPLFKNSLKIKNKKPIGEKNSWRLDLNLK